MRRLVKKAFGKTLYHGTNYEGLLGITQNQMIIANESNGGAGAGFGREQAHEGFSFFATSIDKAFTYAMNSKQDKLKAIIEVSLPESSLQPDDVDCPKCKTWQESDAQIKQVKVTGNITSDYMGKVYLYNPNTNELITESNLKTWQQTYEDNKALFENDEKQQNSLIEELESRGIEVQTMSFHGNNDAFYTFNSSLYEYGSVLNKIDSSITTLYGIIDDDGQVQTTHYENILNTLHKGTKFDYQISSSLVTIQGEYDSYLDEMVFISVFENTTISYKNKTYTADQFIEFLESGE